MLLTCWAASEACWGQHPLFLVDVRLSFIDPELNFVNDVRNIPSSGAWVQYVLAEHRNMAPIGTTVFSSFWNDSVKLLKRVADPILHLCQRNNYQAKFSLEVLVVELR